MLFSGNAFSASFSENHYDQLKQLVAVTHFEDCDQSEEDDPYHSSCNKQYIEYKSENLSYHPNKLPKWPDGTTRFTIGLLGYLANGNTQSIYQVVCYGDGGNSPDSELFEILELKNNKFISKYGAMNYTKFHSAIEKLGITLQSKYGNQVGFDENW